LIVRRSRRSRQPREALLARVARKYGKIVDRWEQLDPLPFDDPQLEEASKAYLYGFYRSGVVLSASALEAVLSRPLVTKRNEATRTRRGRRGLIGYELGVNSTGKAVFRFRNRVVHDVTLRLTMRQGKCCVVLGICSRHFPQLTLRSNLIRTSVSQLSL